MPIYQYKCSDCEVVREYNIPMVHRDELIECACGGTLVRKFGVGGVVIR